MGSLVDDLLTVDAFGPGTGQATLVETHVSRVFLCKADVFKVKRPVDLGFVDFRTLEARREACEAELRLNRRLAPDVYRDLSSIVRTTDGRHVVGGAGEPVEYAVHMRRLPDEDRADVRLQRGTFPVDAVERIAARVLAFHASAGRSTAIGRAGLPEAVRRNVQENLEATRPFHARYLEPARIAELESWQLGFLESHEELFRQRARAGRVVDGHGDLRLEHVYLDGQVTVIDCVEFADRFRHGDVCADLCFLAMDLTWHNRPDLAERLLARYARDSGDFELYLLVDFYESYRAHVRAKIACLLSQDQEARGYFLLALAASRRPLAEPTVVAVCGIIGSGKSTVAAELGRAFPAAVVESDRTRKQLLGLRPEAPAPPSAYEEAVTRRTYDELQRRASCVLDSGRTVILDASFHSRAARARARALATSRGLPFRLVECRASAEVLRARLLAREGKPGVSDARADRLERFSRNFEPVDELPAEEHLVLDTELPADENQALLGEFLPGLLSRPSGRSP